MKGAFPSKESENLPDLHARQKPRERQTLREEKRREQSGARERASGVSPFFLSLVHCSRRDGFFFFFFCSSLHRCSRGACSGESDVRKLCGGP